MGTRWACATHWASASETVGAGPEEPERGHGEADVEPGHGVRGRPAHRRRHPHPLRVVIRGPEAILRRAAEDRRQGHGRGEWPGAVEPERAPVARGVEALEGLALVGEVGPPERGEAAPRHERADRLRGAVGHGWLGGGAR